MVENPSSRQTVKTVDDEFKCYRTGPVFAEDCEVCIFDRICHPWVYDINLSSNDTVKTEELA